MAEQQRYRVIKRLASGGMAEVFVAESMGIEGFTKRVAIKRVLPNLSQKDEFIGMFLDEARLSAQLSHSNVASVFDIGVGDGAYFIVMEYVDGADLRTISEGRKKRGRALPVEIAVFVAAKICQGLGYAHELKGLDGRQLHVVHRDVTPANVLITKYGEVKIVDFGLAKATSQLKKSDQGMIKGKFGYLAPETVLEQPVDHKVDIFAVGILLWEALAGRRLFQGDTDYATVSLVRDAVIPPLSKLNPEVPRELEPVLAKALAKDPAHRYQSARDLGRDLVRFLFKYGRPVSEDDVASIVQAVVADVEREAARNAPLDDGLARIALAIDEMLLEFRSLTKEGDGPEPLSLDIFKVAGKSTAPPSGGADDMGSLYEQLYGADEPAPPPAPKEEEPPPAETGGWFRGLFK